MIPVKDIHDAVVYDNANKDQNGNISLTMFNRLSQRGEIRILDWLTGHVSGMNPPQPYLTQKNKDWVAPFIKKHTAHIQDGKLVVPEDYYTLDNLSLMNAGNSCEEATDASKSECNTVIEVLDGQQFFGRCNSFIKGLRPTEGKPIAKRIGEGFEFAPMDIGDVALDYVRLPKFAQIRTKFDAVYQNETIDEQLSRNYEWPMAVAELLVWTITDLFFIHTREQAGKQANLITGRTEGDRR